jgi:uncharacterized membrane protein
MPQRKDTSTTLTVWHYDSAMGAAAGEIRLKDLQQQGGLEVVDAVTVTWVPGADGPHVGHLMRQGPAAVAKGSALGVLVGTLFLAPVVGAVAGGGVAGLAHRLRNSGLDREFLDDVKADITPGSSALVVLSREADLDKVRAFVERGLARGDVRLKVARLRDDAPAELAALVESAEHGEPGIARSG